MLIVRHGNAVYLERRPPTGIWGGLYSLPEIGSIDALPAWCARTLSAEPAHVESRDTHRHSFTHYDLDIHPIAVHVDAVAEAPAGGGIWYDPGAPAPVGIAAPVAELIRRERRLR